ncbi:MAG: SDR family oxidoreductase [Paracoccaceae bacterium]|nr:SDR family oxidoreductase [Paracoccaceae bacterium]
MRLNGKRALITAAGQGIGRASAEAMMREGAQVFATDVNMETLGTLEGAETFALDARDPDQIAAGAERAQPDILVNCAGFVHAGAILDATEEEWDFAFDLNVKSMFRTIRACLPGMLERGAGSIINMASAASSIMGAPNRCVYGATKGAVIGLTKAVAKDHITQGIRCNAVCPGTVDTPSLHDRMRATGDYETAVKAFIARQDMGRLATADEIAALVVYLASDESAFMTGQACVIDGGWSG